MRMYEIRDTEEHVVIKKCEKYLEAVATVEDYERQMFERGSFYPGYFEIFDTGTGKVVS